MAESLWVAIYATSYALHVMVQLNLIVYHVVMDIKDKLQVKLVVAKLVSLYKSIKIKTNQDVYSKDIMMMVLVWYVYHVIQFA